MHNYLFPLLAALACALCNGAAAVLQKVSADKEKASNDTGDVGLLVRLFQDLPYVLGVALDILGWILTVYAVHFLPLFLVEAIIASSVIVTIGIERIFLHTHNDKRIYSAAGIILLGLVVLALASTPDEANSIVSTARWAITLSPCLFYIIGVVIARSERHAATIALATLSGVCFGATSVIGRIFNLSHPLWHTIYNPLIAGIILSGLVGLWLFSVSLQRARASVVNATMTGAQTLIPTIVGIAVLGDEPRQGLWYLVVVGIALVLTGVSILATRVEAPQI